MVAYDHRSLEVVERCNQSVLLMLQKMCVEDHRKKGWQQLDDVEIFLNLSCHADLGWISVEAWCASGHDLDVLVERRIAIQRR